MKPLLGMVFRFLAKRAFSRGDTTNIASYLAIYYLFFHDLSRQTNLLDIKESIFVV